MRHRFPFLIVTSLIIISCTRQNEVIINGSLESPVKGDMAYIEELRVNTSLIVDSAKVKPSGKFKNSIELKVPGFYQLVFKSGPSLSLILSPGEKISLTADMDNFYNTKQIEGSHNSIRVNVLHDSLRSTIRTLNKIRGAYNLIQDEEIETKGEQEELTQKFIAIKDNYHRYSTIFILEDLTALSNIAALYQEYAEDEYVFHSHKDIQFFKLVSDSLMKYYPEVRYVKTLRDNYLSLFNDYSIRKLLQNTEPISYDIPDLTLPAPDGKNITLSSLKGKLVLLTFWSVTQPESIQNAIELKKIYNSYHTSGFEIYQVSVNNSIKDWKKVLAFEEIPWISVCDTAFPESQSRYLYNVNTFPMNYLIDPQQKEILAKNLTADVLEKSLPNLLNR